MTTAERVAAGKAARRRVPRAAHAVWEPPADRRPVVDTLSDHAAGRMVDSPSAFSRGAAAVMAADLAATPASGLRAQLCGDAHVSNFGGFGSPEGELVFDIDRFDETAVGPWEWDVKRLAASAAIAGRELGMGASARRAAVRATVGAYREAMRGFAAMRNLDVWYARLDARTVARAVGALPSSVPVEEPVLAVEEEMQGLLRIYRRGLKSDRRHLLESYRYVGSVGTRARVVLLTGRDAADRLLLQVKEADASVLEPFAGPDPARNHGQRVVQGQWLMQAASDMFLGWLRAPDVNGRQRDYYVRRLWDGRTSADVERMTAAGLTAYCTSCGWTLARAHARSGDRVAIAAYLGSGDAFDRALATFAESYADQNERDHAAVAAGQVTPSGCGPGTRARCR
jgi:uncharacterized protein (DUF2252 family)